MTQLTKLQRNLYNELLGHMDVKAFNTNYKGLMQGLTQAQRKYYTRKQVFVQGYVYGTPENLPSDTLKNIISKAGYKDTSSDRTYNSYFKVLDKLYELVQ